MNIATLPSHRSPQDRGRFLELALADQLRVNKFSIHSHRYRSRYGEVDLLAVGPQDSLFMIEVKTRGHPAHVPHRLSRVQAQRLRRAYNDLRSCWPSGLVIALLALIDEEGRVTWVQSDFLG